MYLREIDQRGHNEAFYHYKKSDNDFSGSNFTLKFISELCRGAA